MFTRVALFLATNLAVLVLAGIVMSLLGVNPNQLGGPLVFAAIFGFGGSLISLLTSKWMAKRATGAQVIEQPRNDAERWLVTTVQRQAQAAGIGMPEVAVYDAPEINAFATGANRNNALVAVSTGLLRSMNQDEAEAVLGHEVAHIANGDMVTMTLIQGVVNTFVIFLSRAIGFAIDNFLNRGEERRGPGAGYMITYLVLEVFLGLLASMIVAWYSRQREFRADAGSGDLMGQRQSMIQALRRLGGLQAGELPNGLQSMGITGSIGKLFATHPPIEERIARLQQAQAGR